MKFFKSGEKGFTLIELLVVIAILGTLAAVVVLNVTQFMGKGKNEAALTEKANVQTAIAAYMYDHSSTPPASGNVDALSPYFLGTPHGTYTWDPTSGGVLTQTYP